MPKYVKNAENFIDRKKTAMYIKIDLWQGRLARMVAILMMCAVPLYLNHHRYIGLTQHKFEFLVFCMIISLLLVVAIWVYRMTRNPRLTPQSPLNIVDWAVLGFAVVTIISTFASPFGNSMNVWIGIEEPFGRYNGALTQLLYVAIYFIISRWYKPRERDFVLFSFTAILISLIGIFQFFGMDFFNLWPNDMAQHRVDNFFNILIRTTLGNTNIVSTYVSLAVLLTGFLFVRMPPPSKSSDSKKPGWKLQQPLFLAASAFSFWMTVVANADSGRIGIMVAMLFALPFIIESVKTLGRTLLLASSWIAVYTLQTLFFQVMIMETQTASSLAPFVAVFLALLAVGLVLTLRSKEPDSEAPTRWKLGVIVIIACLIVGLVGVEIMGRVEVEEGARGGLIWEMREVLHGNLRDDFGTNRVYIWRHAMSVVPNNLLIGTGPDTFGYAFPIERQLFFGEFYDSAHNEYIQILVCQGILGLIAYLLFLGAVFVKGVTKAFKEPIAAAVLIALLGYCAQAFFNISHPVASQIVWVFAGILVSRKFNEKGRFEF